MDNHFAEQLTRLKNTLDETHLTKTAITELLLQHCLDTLKIGRASLWLFTDDDLMVCQLLLDKHTGITEESLMIDRWSFPRYFSALDNNTVVLAVDAFNDPATAELCEHFLRPLNIRSLLDVPIKRYGKVAGIICCEQTDTLKHWSFDEVEFVISLCQLYSERAI